MSAVESRTTATGEVPTEAITSLDIDHPGAHDSHYRARRDVIARLAKAYRADPRRVIPHIDYLDEETSVWRHVAGRLEAAHRERACASYLKAKAQLGIRNDVIPQLRDLDGRLRALTGFRLAPVDGLVETRAFLSWLGDRTMLSTQYVRHHSRPDYTPEPDIVHEAIGHVPNLTDPDFADFSESIGRGARVASEEQLNRLGRLYWFTVEFGLIEEGDEIKAFGAGLLSSYSELEHAFSDEVERRPFDLARVVETPYDYSDMQPVLYVIPSYAHLKSVTRDFIKSFQS